MANLPLRLIAYTHDHLNPLVTGDVTPDGIDLHFDRTADGAQGRPTAF